MLRGHTGASEKDGTHVRGGTALPAWSRGPSRTPRVQWEARTFLPGPGHLSSWTCLLPRSEQPPEPPPSRGRSDSLFQSQDPHEDSKTSGSRSLLRGVAHSRASGPLSQPELFPRQLASSGAWSMVTLPMQLAEAKEFFSNPTELFWRI